jgi:hypothetical protein
MKQIFARSANFLCPKDKYNRGIITRTPMKKKIA